MPHLLLAAMPSQPKAAHLLAHRQAANRSLRNRLQRIKPTRQNDQSPARRAFFLPTSNFLPACLSSSAKSHKTSPNISETGTERLDESFLGGCVRGSHACEHGFYGSRK